MNASTGSSSGLYHVVKRALEGRATPLTFLLIVGFFSTLVLLYISLHVYFFNLSNEIVASRERLDVLMDTNVHLMAVYNDLTSARRIIPMAQELGMRAGVPDEVHRLALRGDAASGAEEAAWAQAGETRLFGLPPGAKPRMAK